MFRSFTLMAGLALVLAAPAAALAAEPAFSLHEAVGAPDKLSLSGTFRLRYEALDGQARPGVNTRDDLVSLRTTLFAEYKTGAFRIGGELWDSRAYDGKLGGSVGANDVDALELTQVYVATELKGLAGPGGKAELLAGRFMMNLGSRRLVAADDFRNTTNAFTGLRLSSRAAGGWTGEAFYALPQTRLPDDQPSVLKNRVRWDRETTDLALWGGALAKSGLPGKLAVDGSYLGLDERDAPGRPTRDRELRTVTLRVLRAPEAGRFDAEAEGSYQYGYIRSGTQPTAGLLDVSAGFTHLELGYSFRGDWKPRLSLEYERASGDDGKASFGRFDTLYGSRRADLAPSGIYATVGRANIETPAVRFEATPNARLDFGVIYRLMWLASRTDSFSTSGVRDATGRSGDFAGRQWDTRVRWWVVPQSLRLEVNGILLDKGRFLKTAPNAPRTGDTHFVSVALQASF